ncbi:toxin VasX [Psychrobacter vallis]|uniref:toxin VasX n=1 Tax=Psychrobacter vallis TaxID=248451 RepID=UPI001917C0D4|nr:toxin VasX [Psychrobacter vallis]
MSNDLSFMNRLTSNHKSSQDKKKAEPVVLELEYEIPTDDPSVKKCDYECGKTGIPILPVAFSKTDYKVATQDERCFAHEIASIASTHTAVASLPNHAYLYCYIEDSEGYSFKEYYTGADGAFKRTQSYSDKDFKERASGSGQIDVQNINESDSDTSEEDVQPFTCNKKEHSTLDSKYITLLQGDTAWLMVSHAKLSKPTLKKYIEDETLRNKRMQKFVADELTGNKNTINMSTNEVGYIKSFSQRKQLTQGGDISNKVNALEKNGDSKVSGSVLAALSLYQSMQRSIVEYDEGLALEIKPMMVALPDPVGEVIAAAEKRNYLISQLSELSENNDYIRKTINALIIKNLEKASIKTTEFKGKKFFNAGNNDYLGTLLNIGFSDTDPDDLIFKHIDKSSYESYLQSSQKIISLKKEIVNARKVFVKAITSEEFKFIIESDFDIELVHDEQTAKYFEAMIASCIAGCGIDDSNIGIPQSMLDAFESTAPKSDMATEEEFKKVLLPQISSSIKINQNWLFKALGGLDKELVEIIYDFSKKDRASEAVGAGIGYTVEGVSAATLNKITVNSNRSAAINKGKLIQTLSQNLLALSFYDSKAFRNLYKTLELSIYGHSGLVVVPKKVTATADTMAAFANFALGSVLPKSVVNRINERARQAQRGVTSILETVTDTNIVRTPQIDNLQQAKTQVLYYFDEAFSTGKGMSALSQLNDGQRPINLDQLDAEALAARAIEWHDNIKKGAIGATGVLSGFIAFLQLKAVIASVPAIARLKYAGDSLRLTQEQLGTVSSGLALVTASMDVTASGAGLLGKTSFANRLVYRAGWIGVVGATFEVGSLAIYGYRKFNDGNRMSAVMTAGAGASITASAVAGLIYGYGVANAATGGAAAIPGAPLLGVMMIGMTLSYVFQRLAYKCDDKNNTLIEYWLDNSVFGHKAMRGQNYYLINPFQTQPAFVNLEQDISGFITACTLFLANNRLQTFQGNVPVAHEISTNSEIRLPPVLEIVKEHLTLFESQIHIGNWDKASQLTIEVVADKNGREQNLYKATFYNSTSDEPVASTITSLAIERLLPIVTKKETEKESEPQFIIDTQLLKFEPHNINKAKVIVTYMADTSRNPPYPLKDISYLDNNKY